MRIPDLLDIDFTSCDACRQPLSETCVPMIFGVEPAGASELIVRLRVECMATFAGADPANAIAISIKAETTSRLRPSRLSINDGCYWVNDILHHNKLNAVPA